MNGRSHLHTSTTDTTTSSSSTVGTDTAIQGGRARWLTRLAYLYIPTVSVSPEKTDPVLMVTITLELAYRSVLLRDQEGIVSHSDV